jgi:hypothetical protein
MSELLKVSIVASPEKQMTQDEWQEGGRPILLIPVSRFMPTMQFNNEVICDLECWRDVAYGTLYIVSTGDLKIGQEMNSDELDKIAIGKGKDSATVYLLASQFFIEVKSTAAVSIDMSDDKVLWMMGNAENYSPVAVNILEEWSHA